MDEDAALFGMTMPDIDVPEETHFEVLKDNWPVLEAFFVLDGCAWQYSGMGDLIGLDYSAAHIIWLCWHQAQPGCFYGANAVCQNRC